VYREGRGRAPSRRKGKKDVSHNSQKKEGKKGLFVAVNTDYEERINFLKKTDRTLDQKENSIHNFGGGG